MDKHSRLAGHLALIATAHLVARAVGWDGTLAAREYPALVWGAIVIVTVWGLTRLLRKRA